MKVSGWCGGTYTDVTSTINIYSLITSTISDDDVVGKSGRQSSDVSPEDGVVHSGGDTPTSVVANDGVGSG